MNQPQRDDEVTGRTKLADEFPIFRDGVEKRARRVQWWMQFVGGTVIGGVIGIVILLVKIGMYLSNVGHKDVEDALLMRMAVYEKGQQDLADQVKEIARAVHAPVLQTQKLEQPAILKEAK